MAIPAITQPAVKTIRLVAVATAMRAAAPATAPPVITERGPRSSRIRPTGMPARAETISPREKAAVIVVVDHPVSAAMEGARTGKA